MALSTEVTRFDRRRAAPKATCAIRSTSRAYRRRGREPRSSSRLLLAEIGAAGQLAHDQHVGAGRDLGLAAATDARARRSRRAGRRLANRPSALRSASRPASGRSVAPSHCGPPTAPSRIASALSAGGERRLGQAASPCRSIATPPKSCSSKARPRPQRSESKAEAEPPPRAVTSGPMPSPGSRMTGLQRHASPQAGLGRRSARVGANRPHRARHCSPRRYRRRRSRAGCPLARARPAKISPSTEICISTSTFAP